MNHLQTTAKKLQPVLAVVLASSVILATIAGCGSSQSDLMQRAAMRKRGDSDSPDKKKVIVVTNDLEDSKNATSPKPDVAAKDKPMPAEKAGTAEVAADESDIEIPPLEERLAAGEISNGNAEAVAADRIKKIGIALMKLYNQKGAFPIAAKRASNGIATLSWRVELLPYLGYPKLFAKFDPNVPWDMPPNDELLKYIPDEYLSAERNDTKTNFLGPSARNFMFESGGATDEKAEDGLENTILLLEVNNDYAVQWTKPMDFPLEIPEFRNGIGGLRGGGTYALWGNGLPTKLASSLTDGQLRNALNLKGEDRLRAGDIHQPLSSGASEENTVKIANPGKTSVASKSDRETSDSKRAIMSAQSQQRMQVPPEYELDRSRAIVRKLYAKEVTAANSATRRKDLARKLLDQAKAFQNDPAGEFVINEIATRVAVESGDPPLVLDCIDALVERFDVDTFDVHLKTLVKMDTERTSSKDSVGASKQILKRFIQMAYVAVQWDRYDEAIIIIRNASKFAQRLEDRDTRLLVNRVAAQLLATQRKFEDVSESFRDISLGLGTEETSYQIGQFYCFHKGDWDTGLPLLAKSSNDVVRGIAKADLDAESTPAGMIQVGEQWLDLADRARPGIYRQSARHRAGFWLALAADEGEDSLAKVYIESKLAEIESDLPPNTLGLIEHLAEEFDVDLNSGLFEVKG